MEGSSSLNDEENVFGDVPSHKVGSVKRRRNENGKTSNSKRIRRYNHVFDYGDKDGSEEEVDNIDFRYTL